MEIRLKIPISSLMFLIVFVYVHDQRLIILIYMFVFYNYFNDIHEYTHTCMAIQLSPMPHLQLPVLLDKKKRNLWKREWNNRMRASIAPLGNGSLGTNEVTCMAAFAKKVKA